MDHHQHGNITVNLRHRHLHIPHFIIQPQLLNHCPGLLPPLTLKLEHRRPLHRHRRHHSNDRLLRRNDLIDRPRHIILQLGLLRRIQERDHFLLRSTLNRETQIDIVPLRIDLHPLDLILTCLVLLIRIRIRCELFKHHIVIRRLLELKQQILNIARIRAQHRRHYPLVGTHIITDRHRLVRIDASKDVFGSLRQRVKTVFSHIDSEIAEPKPANNVVDDEHDGDHQQSGETNSRGSRGSFGAAHNRMSLAKEVE